MTKNNLLGKQNLAERLKQAKEELALEKPLEEHIQTIPQQKEAAPTKPKTSTIAAKLYVAGRFNRKEHIYISKAFYIHEGLEDQIKTYCRGTDITVYNYLISLGLETIKGLPEMKTVDVADIEEKYETKKNNIT